MMMKGEGGFESKDNQYIGVNTDKAWGNVYTRLRKDGLIAESTESIDRRRQTLYPEWIKWAASFLLLITVGVAIFFSLPKTDDINFISFTNTENNTFIKVLDDGSVVYLAEQSTLSISEYFGDELRHVRLTGEAFFDIKPNHERPFVIETGEHNISVLGTSFNLKTLGEERIELLVEEGSVIVNTKKQSRKSMTVENGEFLRAENQNFEKVLTNDMSVLSWKTNRMHFKDETLQNILSVINRNYNSRLYIELSELKERKMTVTFYNNSLPTIIELICLSMNLKAEENPETGVLFKPKT